uniref:pyridoxal-phosphate dependent enzyme n=1 Tax=Okeania hirsuta TaxID=1458930 RepID=UPI000F53A5C5
LQSSCNHVWVSLGKFSRTENYAKENGYFDVNQYNNIYNPEAYYQTLGPEIWKQTNGEITHFVMTGSTFGCISGTGSFLKECNPKVKVILADPVNSNIYAYYYSNYSNSKNDLSLNSSLGQFSIIGITIVAIVIPKMI